MSNKYQRALYATLGGKTIAYNASIARALGSVKAGVLMAQLLYWEGMGKDKIWTYKTAEELYEETALTRREQDSAIRKCSERGVLEVKLARIPATRHFRINKERLAELLSSFTQKGKLDSPLEADKYNQNGKSTTDNTQDITAYIRKRTQGIAKTKRIIF